jgi:hypothetical protein
MLFAVDQMCLGKNEGLIGMNCLVGYLHDGGFVRIAHEYDGAVVVFAEVFSFMLALVQ